MPFDHVSKCKLRNLKCVIVRSICASYALRINLPSIRVRQKNNEGSSDLWLRLGETLVFIDNLLSRNSSLKSLKFIFHVREQEENFLQRKSCCSLKLLINFERPQNEQENKIPRHSRQTQIHCAGLNTNESRFEYILRRSNTSANGLSDDVMFLFFTSHESHSAAHAARHNGNTKEFYCLLNLITIRQEPRPGRILIPARHFMRAGLN